MPKDKTRTPEAALGQPSTEHADPCGQLQVPYLSWSYKELRALRNIPADPDEQQAFFYSLVQRRLPGLTSEEFEERCGPQDISAWINGLNMNSGGGEGNA